MALVFSFFSSSVLFFFFNDPATTEIYTLSLHDALPISPAGGPRRAARSSAAHHPSWLAPDRSGLRGRFTASEASVQDRKSTRLNSSHGYISYAVFCLKKKKKKKHTKPVNKTTTIRLHD